MDTLRFASGPGRHWVSGKRDVLSSSTSPLPPKWNTLLTPIDDVAALALPRDLMSSALVGQLEYRVARDSAEHCDDLPGCRDLRQAGSMLLAFDHWEYRKRVDVDRRSHRVARISAGAFKAEVLADSSNARRIRAPAVSW